MTQIHVLVTSEVSATATKNLVRIHMVKYITASQVGNILYWDKKHFIKKEYYLTHSIKFEEKKI